MAICNNCGRQLHKDEKAIYKRLINRAATEDELLCKLCLASKLAVTETVIEEKIKHFRDIGCTLFM
ncbi:MAG: hypothetical protein IKT46_03375 [Clostridia bacterium]|nr:hypothetical protein [Clostridia bacterium]